MAKFRLFKKIPFFSAEENKRIVEAIRRCEKTTSGEIRVFVESRNPMVEPLDRAREIFFNLKMQDTDHRNAVLLYIAMKDNELALFGDEGIYAATFEGYWDMAVKEMLGAFSKENITDGIVACITKVGDTLKEKFPYEASTDKNELPDDIVFGK